VDAECPDEQAAEGPIFARLTLVLGGETLVERAKIDYHSLMKAVADSSISSLAETLNSIRFPSTLMISASARNIVAHRRSGKVPDIYRMPTRALAHIQKWPDRIEGCVFHDQDHDRGRQHLRQHGVLN